MNPAASSACSTLGAACGTYSSRGYAGAAVEELDQRADSSAVGATSSSGMA
ncbi:hypothetical protein AB0K48_37010 [Nonomuraea sp. NPDC055795]